jgi:archaemetzincin
MFIVVAVSAACSVVGPDRTPRRDSGVENGAVTPADRAQPQAPLPARPPESGEQLVPSLASKVLYLQPLGAELSTEAVDLVVTALREFYGFQVKGAPSRELPPFAYYPPRKRFRAEKLLSFLAGEAPPDAFRVLGLTAVDISTTKGRVQDWGIMGLATLDGRVAVMSMFRCRRGSRSEAHARERLGKVAVHEVGHTLGLEHCPTRGCLMEDARGTNTTTDREYVMCPHCRELLRQQGIVLPPDPAPPWPRP